MKSRWAKLALVAGLVTSALAFAMPWTPLAYALLVATVVLVPGAVCLELVARRDARRAVLVTTLFVAGILLFADSQLIGGIGYIATIVLLVAIGFAEGHIRAVVWAIVFLASAFAADVLWLLEFGPFDRDADYEPLPQSPFILISLPIPMALIALGVGLRWIWRRLSASGQPRARRPGLPG